VNGLVVPPMNCVTHRNVREWPKSRDVLCGRERVQLQIWHCSHYELGNRDSWTSHHGGGEDLEWLICPHIYFVDHVLSIVGMFVYRTWRYLAGSSLRATLVLQEDSTAPAQDLLNWRAWRGLPRTPCMKGHRVLSAFVIYCLKSRSPTIWAHECCLPIM
jgi:hypothetical protein